MAKPNKENIKIGKSLEELVTYYDQKFIEALPKLYKKKAEREVIEAIVIPHFRSELAKVLIDFLEQRKDAELPVLPDEVPAFCEAVDAMIEANKVPLLVDEYFGKGLARINAMREEAKEQLNEIFYAHCRQMLADRDVTSRKTLLQKGSTWFQKERFPPYGKAFKFAGSILGRVIGKISLEILGEIADVLQLPEIDDEALEEKREQQREALKQKGVPDRRTLLQKGVVWFAKEKFPSYGRGYRFAGAILGRTIRYITPEILGEIGDVLQLPGVDEGVLEKERKKQLEVLANKGVQDRRMLLQKGVVWFAKENFSPYGKGSSFARAILGRVIGKVSLGILNEIADILGFSEIDEEEEFENKRKVLEQKGVQDRRTLLQKGPTWFQKEKFPQYGMGCTFAGAILERTVGYIAIEILNEIADVLQLPEVDKEVLKKECKQQREVLAEKGITDCKTLLKKGPKWFQKEIFPPYGKAQTFAGAILDRTVGNITRKILNEIANVLQLPEVDDEALEKERKKQQMALKRKGITDRRTLLQKGVVWFVKETFSPYGKGPSFAKTILGRTLKDITLKILNEIADVLQLPEVDEEVLEKERKKQREALAKKGVPDRRTLLQKGSKWFAKETFFSYGTGYGFARAILGRAISRVTLKTLNKIADILELPD